MKLISISKTVEKIKYEDNIQNYKTWKEMSKYFDSVYLIVESTDNRWHYQQCGKISVTWLPKAKKPFEFAFFLINAYKCALRLIKTNDIDVIDVGEPICAGLAAIALKRATKKPLLVQVQGQVFNLPSSYALFKRKLVRRISIYVAKRADRIRVVSEEIKKTAVKNGIVENKIFVSPSRCDTQVFDRQKYKEKACKLKKELKIPSEKTVYCFVGRLIEAKDVESILKAIPLIATSDSDIHLLIVGDGKLKESLLRLVQQLKIEEYVSFLGRVPYSDIPIYLAASDIFISPSLDEGLPRAVLEAMSMELAVVVTPVGGNPEIIEEGKDGVFVEIQNPQSIAKKVNYLLDNKDVLERIRKNARKKIEKKYDFGPCIKEFAELHYL